MNPIVALDIGTTKVCCLVAQPSSTDALQVVGYGVAPCRGLRQGTVIDIDQTVMAIEQAVHDAQAMADLHLNAAFVGVTGAHIETIQRRAEIAITRPDREITEEDLERLRQQVQQIALPPDHELLHTLIRHYIVDNQRGITNPIGMSATHLQAEALLVTGRVTFLQNIRRCVERAGLQPLALVLEPYASGLAVLSPEEREVGAALLDIGGGTTDVAVFVEGGLAFTAVVPLGGNHVSRDVYLMFRIATPDEAERVKREYGCALAERVPDDELVTYREMGSLQQRRIPRRMLTEVIEERMREILELAYAEIQRSGLADRLAAGVVLTGGGSCLPCTADLGRQVFGSLPVRLGVPTLSHLTTGERHPGIQEGIQQPAFATAVGLLLIGAQERMLHPDDIMPLRLWKLWLQKFKRLFRR
jgi:cell division protein FtsA